MSRAVAPGKLILCGEHAVVYGQPAIALPVAGVAAAASVRAGDAPLSGSLQVVLDLPDVAERWAIEERPGHPLAQLVVRTLEHLRVTLDAPITVVLESSIPIASGMGSGAALAAALVRALAGYYGHELHPETVSGLVYEAERYYHGTPSGIDNTVVSFGYPIWYRRPLGHAVPIVEPLVFGGPLTLVIADTGLRSPTHVMVDRVRDATRAQPRIYEAHFEAIGQLVCDARAALIRGDNAALGLALDHNHRLLQLIGVSSPELDRLVIAARHAGAMGAKLSGGGGGGVMLALVSEQEVPAVEAALAAAGAVRVIRTPVLGPGEEASLV